MRYLFGFLCVCALGLMPLVGCETAGDGGGGGGSAGSGGTGGAAGTGGSGGTDLCEGWVYCDETECRIDGVCDASDGMCDYTLVDDGTACAEGECLDGVCAPVGAFPCTEQGIRDAIAEGGGPHFFACDGTTPVVTQAEILIHNDVILDGQGKLTVDGNDRHRVFSVPEAVTVELHRLGVTRGRGAGIANSGTLSMTSVTVSDSDCSGDPCNGGGILNEAAGTMTVTNSTVSGNAGDAILNEGTLTLTTSTVTGDETNMANGGTATLTVTNSTIDVTQFAAGGAVTITNSTIERELIGIALSGPICGTQTLTNSTVSGSILLACGDVSWANTIVHGECKITGPPPDQDDLTITSNGYNIESPLDTCGFDPDGTDQVNVSAEALNLGWPADNGGPTITHKPGVGSVAIDQIPGDACDLTEDQRGQPRPETGGTRCDVGSVEVQEGGQ